MFLRRPWAALQETKRGFFFFFLMRSWDIYSFVCGNQNMTFSRPNQTCHLSSVICHLSPVTCHLPVSWNRKDQNDQKLLNISVLTWSLVWTITTVWNILLLTFFVLSIQSLFTFVWFQLSNDIHILLFQSRPYFLSHTHIEHRHLANRATGFYFWPLCSSIRTVWG